VRKRRADLKEAMRRELGELHEAKKGLLEGARTV
jgi:hypothetical protein